MNEIKSKGSCYLDEFDINVNYYLTYAQIQQIVDSTAKLNSWSEREQNIDMLMLLHATDIGADILEQVGHDLLLQSGLIDTVRNHICNLSDIYKALNYTQSTERALAEIGKRLPEYFKPLKKAVDRHESSIHE